MSDYAYSNASCTDAQVSVTLDHEANTMNRVCTARQASPTPRTIDRDALQGGAM